MLPITMAEESITTGPCTSISPFTAPAIAALVAVMLPMTTELAPIFTEPSLTISPLILAPSAKISAALEFPLIYPVIFSLPRISIFQLIVPTRSIDPSELTSPVITIPVVITAVSSDAIFASILFSAPLLFSVFSCFRTLSTVISF